MPHSSPPAVLRYWRSQNFYNLIRPHMARDGKTPDEALKSMLE